MSQENYFKVKNGLISQGEVVISGSLIVSQSAIFLDTISGSINNALTASFLLGFVESASFAQTASYLSGSAETASFALTASYAISSSIAEDSISSSYALTSSYALNSVPSVANNSYIKGNFASNLETIAGTLLGVTNALFEGQSLPNLGYADRGFNSSVLPAAGMLEKTSPANTGGVVNLVTNGVLNIELAPEFTGSAGDTIWLRGFTQIGGRFGYFTTTQPTGSYVQKLGRILNISGSQALIYVDIVQQWDSDATTAATASYLNPLNQDAALTGSLNIFGNLDVIGTASFTSVTASSVLVDQNTITVFGSGSVLPTAGYRAVDTASISNSGSLLYNFENKGWISSAPITASFFHGTASIANGLTSSISQSLNIDGGVTITGSLFVNGVEVGKGGASITISGSIPSGSKESGSLWWNENDGNLYIQVTSPTGSTYVPATNTVAGGNYGATLTTARTGSVWTINHNLNTTAPLITVYSGSSVMIPASIISLDANNTQITFSGSVAGTAVLSTGIGNETLENAVTASYTVSSSFATTSSFITPLNQIVSITGSTSIFGNLNVLGTASFTSVTASSVLVNQNTITVFGSGSALPSAGYRAVDTASVSNSGSLLYNFENRGWISSAPITASFFQGTASFAVSSSRAVSASFATTASTNTLAYANVVLGGFWPTTNNTDITISSVTGVGVTTSGNVITIQNAGVYMLSANCSIPNTNFAEYVWTNTSNTLLSGISVGWSPSPSGVQTASPTTAAGIITLAAGTQLKLRTSIVNGVTAVEVPYYYNIQIIQLR